MLARRGGRDVEATEWSGEPTPSHMPDVLGARDGGGGAHGLRWGLSTLAFGKRSCMALGDRDGVDYHVNYRGPNYLPEVWHLCGAFDNLAEAEAALKARIASDIGKEIEAGSEWRLVAVHNAEVVAVIDHVRLTAGGIEPVRPVAEEP